MKTLMQALNEASLNKKPMMNKIYDAVQKLTSKLYRDDHWQGVTDVKEAIEKLGYKASISVKDGEYRVSKDGTSQWKEYEFEITNGTLIIHGTLSCHQAGSVKDPWDRYDMSLVLW